VLDSAFRVPGTKVRVGLDPILGLVPGIGDFLAAVLSSYAVVAAARLNVPRSVLARMVINLGVDTIVGSIPFLGDLFDVGWKANTRNAVLLDNYMLSPKATQRSSSAVVVAVAAVLAVMFGISIVIAGAFLTWMVRTLA
jgi:uncharacterized protein YjeT (DUF2065 family)